MSGLEATERDLDRAGTWGAGDTILAGQAALTEPDWYVKVRRRWKKFFLMRKSARRAKRMVRQVTDTEPTMAKSSCWSIPDCSVLWLPRLGGTLSAPAEGREGGSWATAEPCTVGLHRWLSTGTSALSQLPGSP